MLLDAANIALLELLCRDGQMSARDLAAKVGLSKSAVAVRLAQLKDNGIILGYRAVIAPSMLGADIDLLASIDLQSSQPKGLREFEAAVGAGVGILGFVKTGPRRYQIRMSTLSTWSWVEQVVTRCGLSVATFSIEPVLEEFVPYRDPPLRALAKRY